MVEIGPKGWFFWRILRLFCLYPLTLCELRPKILPNERPYSDIDKFLQNSICGCEVQNFLSFSYWFSIHEMAPFFGRGERGEDSSPYFHKYCSILLKIWTELKWNAPKVYNFGTFWGSIYHLKTKIYAKTAPLGILNNVSPRSQKNHRILVELSKKKKHKLCLNCHLGPHQRFIRNSDISYNRVIHLLSGCQVSSSGYLLFSTLPRTNDNVYFVSGPNWLILGDLGAITPVNNVRCRWNFDHR